MRLWMGQKHISIAFSLESAGLAARRTSSFALCGESSVSGFYEPLRLLHVGRTLVKQYLAVISKVIVRLDGTFQESRARCRVSTATMSTNLADTGS